MLETRKYLIKGLLPLVMEGDLLSDPHSSFAIAYKDAKKSTNDRTEADDERRAEIEFKSALYLGEDKEPIIPAQNIKGCIKEGASQLWKEGKKERSKKDATRGVFCFKDAKLVYDGPKTEDGLWRNKSFRCKKKHKVQGVPSMRTRPKFDKWEAEVEIGFMPPVQEKHITAWLSKAGIEIGICGLRGEFGRFKTTPMFKPQKDKIKEEKKK